MQALVEGLRALGIARLAAMGAVALGMLGMLALLVLRGGTEPMALLYGDLDLRDSAPMVDQLARQHIQYRIAANGAQIFSTSGPGAKCASCAGQSGTAYRWLGRLRNF